MANTSPSLAAAKRGRSSGVSGGRESLSAMSHNSDGTHAMDSSGPYTPYSLQTKRGVQTPPPRSHRGGDHTSPVGQYIRRSAYPPDEAPAGRRIPRSAQASSSHRATSRGRSQSPQTLRGRGSEPSVHWKSDGVCSTERGPVARSSSPPPTGKAKRADVLQLEQCLQSTEKGLASLQSELRRVASPYTVTASSHSTCHNKIGQGRPSPQQSAREAVRDRGDGAGQERAFDFAGTVERCAPSRVSCASLRTPSSHPAVERDRAESSTHASLPQVNAAAKKSGTSLSQSPDASWARIRGPSQRTSPVRDARGAAVCGTPVRRQASQSGQRGAAEGPGSCRIQPKLDELISIDEKKRFRAAWKEAHAQLAAKMNEWVHDLPDEIRSRVTKAAGVDAKFLALRDCALALCGAAESRALSLIKARKKNDESKQSLKAEQHKAESAMVDVQGGLLAASKKIQQLDRLVRLTTRQTFAGHERESGRSTKNGAAGGASPYTAYKSIYIRDSRGGSENRAGDYPVLIDTQEVFGASCVGETPRQSGSLIQEESAMHSAGQRPNHRPPATEAKRSFTDESAAQYPTYGDINGSNTSLSSSDGSSSDTTEPPSSMKPLRSIETTKGAGEPADNQEPPQKPLHPTHSVEAAADWVPPRHSPEMARLNEDVSWARDFISQWRASRT
ncbi:hypothetical protein BESB_001330 [Besnoitia besnoiti]|uniref:Uncharacterized protein n=1 Tax=Besnoitia besnoiti TaxID=94643 RepID=A0A2A9MMU7_BESBE|nr:hypothetical protein BESB_001330 [Besnoitia besnoiti]PFH37791.1 hypothetical protein BESB_001330 [Besnoitia besnoiti]